MSIPFRQAPFTITGGTVARSLDARHGEVINVMDLGATGDGVTNDAPAIQAAFDLAFGSSASPHGTSGKFSNRPVYFPAGDYSTTSQLNLTRVVGGHIYGDGRGCTRVRFIGTVAGGATKTSALRINGAVDLCMERITFAMHDPGQDNSYALDLDWDGTSGGEGLHHNMFSHCAFQATGVAAVIIGDTDNEGYNNIFLHCGVGGGIGAVDYGFDVRGAEALDNLIVGGGGYADLAFCRCPSGGGSVHAQGMSMPGGNTVPHIDYVMESSHIMTLTGIRTEAVQLLRQESGIVVIQGLVNATHVNAIEVNGGKCIIEGAQMHYPVEQRIFGTGGELYLNGVHTGVPKDDDLLDNYTGTVVWDADGYPT
jgi:hypothetical protein